MKKSDSQTPYVAVKESFYPKAKELRKFFDEQFKNPYVAHEMRFVWDYWNVPDQYCHLRTPAYHYFPQDQYVRFHEHLVHWGRENLGCHDISPTWLSCYPSGSFQNLHVDEPHGPLAFVYSLTLDPQAFRGGRTLISKEKGVKGIQGKKREAKIAPEKALKKKLSLTPNFNRLIVFDPSFPHGVSETSGTKDPRQARLVIHGWFIQPRPFWEGPLAAPEVQSAIDDLIHKISDMKGMKSCRGYLGFRLHISYEGKVKKLTPLVSTLTSAAIQKAVIEAAKDLRFSKQGKGSLLTIPLVFS